MNIPGGMNTFHIFLPDLANIIIPLNGLLNKEKMNVMKHF